MKKLALKKRKMMREKNDNSTEEGSKPQVIDLDSVHSLEPTKQSMWVGELSIEDEKILVEGHWLNDKLINAGQALIRNHYKHVRGLQDVSLGQTLGYDVMSNEGFVQIIHTGRSHWLTISTINCSNADEVAVYDSLPPSVTSSLQEQTASLLCTKSEAITLRYILV